MATHAISILGSGTTPDTSGNVFLEPTSVVFANDRFNVLVWGFADTATRDKLHFSFNVPKNYVGTASFRLKWYCNVTSGNSLWKVNYKAMADTESADPSTDDEDLSFGSVAVPGTAKLWKYTSVNATSGNFVADDQVHGSLSRDGVNESSGAAATLYVGALHFIYADA